MPPRLALGICFLFVWWAFRSDSRNHPRSPLALLLPTLWMMRCGSRSIDYWIGGGDIGRWDPVLIAILSAMGLLVMLRRSPNWRGILSHNSALFLFYGYMVLSSTWAEEVDNPAIKMMRPIGDLIMALLVVTESDPLSAILTIWRRTSILLIPLSIVLIRYFAYLGRMEDKHWGADSWIGVTTHKNPLGQLCLISAFAFIWELVDAHRSATPLKRQRMTLLYLALTAYLMLAGGSNSRSSTSIFCLLLAASLYSLFGYLKDRARLIIRRIFQGAIALGFLAMSLQLSGTSLQAVVAESFGKDSTLTDRTYLWQDVVRLGFKSPFFGSGYGGFWVPSIYSKLSPQIDNGPMEAHNGYLETFANLGLVGLAILLCVIIQSIRNAADQMNTNFEYGRLRLVLLLTVVVMNYSEATFPRGNHLWWFGFLIVALSNGNSTIYSQAQGIQESSRRESANPFHAGELNRG
jgi:exopolysaccharide production protein ExoQ